MWVVDSPEKKKSCQGWRDFFFYQPGEDPVILSEAKDLACE
jgi:hypothetical protein